MWVGVTIADVLVGVYVLVTDCYDVICAVSSSGCEYG